MSIGNRVERYKELVAINAISKQDYDDAVAALKQAEAEVKPKGSSRKCTYQP